jgi:hypothetical protein
VDAAPTTTGEMIVATWLLLRQLSVEIDALRAEVWGVAAAVADARGGDGGAIDLRGGSDGPG